MINKINIMCIEDKIRQETYLNLQIFGIGRQGIHNQRENVSAGITFLGPPQSGFDYGCIMSQKDVKQLTHVVSANCRL